MQLILIRHGETLWNKEGRVQGTSDVELSAYGQKTSRASGFVVERSSH